jgi:RimJ/RimL family protein N-acetyltransferase
MKDVVQTLKSGMVVSIDRNLSLRVMAEKDITSTYVAWLNDDEVVQYTEQRFHYTTADDVKSFIDKIAVDPTELMYGIFFDDLHIGNIKLGTINSQHQTASLSYLIGARKWWGKGIASRAIATISDIGFQRIGLMKICAGVYENNIASSKALVKNGYFLEGRRVGQYVYQDKRIDALLYAKHKDTYTAVKSES